jgi:hypothetical protein
LFKKTLLTLVAAAALVFPALATAGYAVNMDGMVGNRHVMYSNGVPHQVTYGIYDYYGGSFKGSIVIRAATTSTNVFSSPDLARLIGDFDKLHDTWSYVYQIRNDSRNVEQGSMYVIMTRENFSYQTHR